MDALISELSVALATEADCASLPLKTWQNHMSYISHDQREK